MQLPYQWTAVEHTTILYQNVGNMSDLFVKRSIEDDWRANQNRPISILFQFVKFYIGGALGTQTGTNTWQGFLPVSSGNRFQQPLYDIVFICVKRIPYLSHFQFLHENGLQKIIVQLWMTLKVNSQSYEKASLMSVMDVPHTLSNPERIQFLNTQYMYLIGPFHQGLFWSREYRISFLVDRPYFCKISREPACTNVH